MPTAEGGTGTHREVAEIEKLQTASPDERAQYGRIERYDQRREVPVLPSARLGERREARAPGRLAARGRVCTHTAGTHQDSSPISG